MIASADIPVLPRGVRRHEDKVRGVPVLLGPERVIMLDPIGVAILSRVDGIRQVAAIAQELSAIYDAPRDVIEPDVLEYLQDLADKRFLEVRHA